MSGSEAKWTFAQKFYVDFSAIASELASRLDTLKSGLDIPAASMQTLTSDLSRLTKSLSDATGSLPSYDQRQCELQLNALEKRLEELRGASAGVPKFSFKRKAAKPVKPSVDPAPGVVHFPTKLKTTMESARTLTGSSNRYLTILDVRAPNSSEEISISDLNNCIVNLLSDEDQSNITALHVQRVSGSVVLLPRISGSIILYDLSDCVIVVGCHQFRMHNSSTVDVYLDSGSDPVIEHCSRIRFAAYPTSLVRGGTLKDDRHLAVKDFSHILPTLSPNWSSLPEERWEKTWPVVVLRDQELRAELERVLPTHTLAPP